MLVKSTYSRNNKTYTFLTMNQTTLRVFRDDGYYMDIFVGDKFRTDKYNILVRITSLCDRYHLTGPGYYLNSKAVDPKEKKGNEITAQVIIDKEIANGRIVRMDLVSWRKFKDCTIEIRETEVKLRKAQQQFRKQTLTYYKACVVTGTKIDSALDAAHIEPADGYNDTLGNSLMLRNDVHKLFDQFLWSINPKTKRVILSDEMDQEPYYKQFSGIVLDICADEKYLKYHYKEFKKRFNVVA
ncbi:HNH endonuclease [Vibrio vulnificus]|uniref:HNH endonuclease n=2 Tax=Vibrio vulnificus TaxID=672 RepID=UPI0040589C75